MVSYIVRGQFVSGCNAFVYQYPRGGTAVVESYVVETLQLLQQFSGLNSSLSYMDEYWQMRLT